MTKTFTTTKGEYLLVEVPEDAYNFSNLLQSWQIDYHQDHEWNGGVITIESSVMLRGYAKCKFEIISLLKDITEEQAKEIVGGNPSDPLLSLSFIIPDCDSSLNWLLLKKI